MSSRKNTVNVARFKAHLSRYLKDVQRGEELTITDCNLPVAKVVPIVEAERLTLTPAARPWARLAKLDIPKPKRVLPDPVDFLLEERRRER